MNYKHGKADTPIYQIWLAMKNRCYNKHVNGYNRYGGRGIIVCERWMKFENFYADMGDRPEGRSLDRINNDGPYSPSNCRWATQAEQHANRAFSNVMCCRTIAEWSRLSGIKDVTLRARIKRGWSLSRALKEPVHSHG